MSTITVTTQAELDKAIRDKIDWIDIRSEAGVWLEVTACDSSTVRAWRGRCVKAAEEALAAGYSKPRTVTTVEELDALPTDAVVLSAAGVAYQCNSDGDVKWWAYPGDQRIFASRKLSLPATVLYEPEAEK